MRKRFNIITQTSLGGHRSLPNKWNRDPLRPGSVADALTDAMNQQFAHLSRDGTRDVRGLDLRGTMVDGFQTGSVWMWWNTPTTKSAVVIRVEEAN